MSTKNNILLAVPEKMDFIFYFNALTNFKISFFIWYMSESNLSFDLQYFA